MSKKVLVIGSGFAGLSAAAYLAQSGCEVTVLEKNEGPGGRASVFKTDGFTFDMGPSWYWMPDVFEKWFGDFGKKVSDYYDLRRVDPSYRVWFGPDDFLNVPAKLSDLYELFEKLEPGCGPNLKKFLEEAAYKYEVGMNDLVYKPGRSLLEFADPRILIGLFKLDLFKKYSKHVDGLFSNERIKRILEFPVYFLGAVPENTPALYSLMSYADLALGTWYPMGGMHQIIKGMVQVCQDLGVVFEYHAEVLSVEADGKRARFAVTENQRYEADVIVAGGDYHHIEQNVLKPEHRKYSEKYWQSRTMAPSSLIFYLGLDRKIEELEHHNLFFDKSFDALAKDIYSTPQWPADPLFYVNITSKTDPSTAPEGHENMYILIPVAIDLEDTEEAREAQYNKVMDRMEVLTGQPIRSHVIYKRSFAHRDFKSRYHAFRGNAYGLANTLRQTAILKPSLKSPKLDNFYYTGQLTTPGPGVPPSLISGKVVAGEVLKDNRWSS